MKCIAIDDEPRALEIVDNYIGRIDFLELTGKFRDPLGAIEYLTDNSVDLLFIDINMPGISGIDLIKVIKNKPLIVFTTAYSEYAIESYELDAVDYLLKPFEFERFLKSVIKARDIFKLRSGSNNKLLKESSQNTDSIQLKSGTETFLVKLNDIIYIEGLGNYINVFLTDRKIVTYTSLKDFLDKLPDKEFIRIHKSYIVSLKHVLSYENHQVKLDGKIIPIGKKYRKMLFDLLKQE